MDSDDEDVMFENSVLHQVLAHQGVTNLIIEPRSKVEDHGKYMHKETDLSTKVFDKKRQCCFNSDLGIGIFYGSEILQEVHYYHRYHILRLMTSSPILSEDDQLFLQSYVDEHAPTKDPSACLSLFTFNFTCLLLGSLTFVNTVTQVGIFSSWMELLGDIWPQVNSRWSVNSSIISTLLVNLVWLFCFAVPVLLLKKRVQKKVLSKMMSQDKCIQSLVMEAEQLLRLEKKCLRLVKESELVARGFTLASQHCVVSRSSHGQAASSNQLCPGLRQVIFTENIKVMQEVKKAVIKFTRCIPMICMDSDFSTLKDMTALGDSQEIKDEIMLNSQEAESADKVLVEQSAENVVNSKRNTEEHNRNIIISPLELTRSAELLSVYFSGFIRRLALCFYEKNLRDKTIDPYEATKESNEMSRAAIERARTLIMQSYTFYRSVHQYDRNSAAKRKEHSEHIGQNHVYNLYVCVNSLDLHLQSLLQITRDLTMSLEEKVDEEQTRRMDNSTAHNAINEVDRIKWEDTFKRIKSSLESCRGCYEESMKHLYQRTGKDTTTASPVKETSLSKVETIQTKVTMIPDEDPVIVDQVFEAFNDSGEEEDCPKTRQQYNLVNRLKHQEEKEALMRFRQELQAVVDNRAVFQKAREELALARARGLDIANQKTNMESSLILPSELRVTHTQNVEPCGEFSEREDSIVTALESRQHSRAINLIKVDDSKQEYVHLEKQNHSLEKASQVSVESKEMVVGMSIWDLSNQRVEGSNPSLNCPLTNIDLQKEGESLDHKYETETVLHSEVKNKCSLEDTLDKGIFSDGYLGKVNTESNSVSKSDELRKCNFKLKQNVVSLDNSKSCKIGYASSEFLKIGHNSSEPCKIGHDSSELCNLNTSELCNKGHGNMNPHSENVHNSLHHNSVNTGGNNFYETQDSAIESSQNPSETYLMEKCTESFIHTPTSSEAAPLHQAINSKKSTFSCHNDVFSTQIDSENRAENQNQSDVDHGKLYNRNVVISPMPSSSFTRSIAMMAASQAKNITGTYLKEEQFGDGSSDSENSDSENSDSENSKSGNFVS